MKKPAQHISGRLHVTGSSKFIADEPPLPNQLCAKLLFSPVAHARIISINTARASAIPGVHSIIIAEDIPGQNQIGHVIKDEPLFPTETIMYIGQPLAMVLAADPLVAEEAIKQIELDYEELKPTLSIDEADAQAEWYIPERRIECGDIDSALASSEHVLCGEVESSAQEHFYMETQRCRAVPGEGQQLTLYTATQSTMEVQEVLSHVLGISANNIIIDVPRLGGAFGGKERAGTIWACLAGLAAYLSKRPVELVLTRDEDMLVTGKRHPFKSKYRIGFDSDGKIKAFDIELLANGGAYADLSIAILERAMFHAENIYHIPNCRIRGRACRTNLPPNTAFRGFGAPQGIFVIESVMQKVAEFLAIDPLDLRIKNSYQKGEQTPYGQEVREPACKELLQHLKTSDIYDKQLKIANLFNQVKSNKKQGIGISPVKFGISFTTAFLNQGSALLWIYIDGTASLTTGGIEMGQELSTKCAIVVSHILGIPIDKIRVESSNSQRVGNASPTAASTGSDINGNAALNAASQIKENLIPVAVSILKDLYDLDAIPDSIVFEDGWVYSKSQPQKKITFPELVQVAYNQRVPLAAYGYYKTPNVHFDREAGKGTPFFYYVYGVALSRVEVDLLTGEHTMLDTYIIHENAQSLNPEIDRGQIIGAFIQSYGWCTMEDVRHDETGRYISINPSTYKIPGIRDLPQNFVVEIVPSKCSEASVLGSKATGEPPFIYGLSVFFAIRDAIRKVNPDAELRFPATPENVIDAIYQSTQEIR